MDLASVVGLLVAVSLILGSILMGSAPLTAFIDVPSMMVVLGGSTAAALMSFPLRNILGLPPSVPPRIIPVTPPSMERLHVQWEAIVDVAAQRRPNRSRNTTPNWPPCRSRRA